MNEVTTSMESRKPEASAGLSASDKNTFYMASEEREKFVPI